MTIAPSVVIGFIVGVLLAPFVLIPLDALACGLVVWIVRRRTR